METTFRKDYIILTTKLHRTTICVTGGWSPIHVGEQTKHWCFILIATHLCLKCLHEDLRISRTKREGLNVELNLQAKKIDEAVARNLKDDQQKRADDHAQYLKNERLIQRR